MSEPQWKQVTTQITYWKPEKENDTIEGLYLGSKKSLGMQGKERTTVMLQKDDQTVVGLPSNAVIEAAFMTIQFGTRCKLIYKGQEPNKNGKTGFKKYDIFTA